MNEQLIASAILAAAYVVFAPMLLVIFNPVCNGFKEDYKEAFMGFHLIMFFLGGCVSIVHGIFWALGVLLEQAA
ncbi:hypothetical protein JC525_09015 [Alteromonas sp. IB21]|uniref:hypothetical protein n=1 Tax=Alteromonas sp. IB21 TaxID=2779369 RepID=UPI0018E8FED1|nr:hypothetical protein [Alteromonas sp. IB21]MBJ2129076.1 hypothetical protein [Alteromonas sp. IB21]